MLLVRKIVAFLVFFKMASPKNTFHSNVSRLISWGTRAKTGVDPMGWREWFFVFGFTGVSLPCSSKPEKWVNPLESNHLLRMVMKPKYYAFRRWLDTPIWLDASGLVNCGAARRVDTNFVFEVGSFSKRWMNLCTRNVFGQHDFSNVSKRKGSLNFTYKMWCFCKGIGLEKT